jgi:hypothetical protein
MNEIEKRQEDKDQIKQRLAGAMVRVGVKVTREHTNGQTRKQKTMHEDKAKDRHLLS